MVLPSVNQSWDCHTLFIKGHLEYEVHCIVKREQEGGAVMLRWLRIIDYCDLDVTEVVEDMMGCWEWGDALLSRKQQDVELSFAKKLVDFLCCLLGSSVRSSLGVFLTKYSSNVPMGEAYDDGHWWSVIMKYWNKNVSTVIWMWLPSKQVFRAKVFML